MTRPSTRTVSLSLVASIALAFCATPAIAGGLVSATESTPSLGDYLVDEIIVRFTDSKPGIGLAAAEVNQRIASLSAATGSALSFSHTAGAGATIARTASRMTLTDARRLARLIARQPGVLYAEPNERDFPQLVPNDTRYAADQWPLKAVVTSGSINYGINAPAAWDITTGSASVRVAVLDTGIRPHADLAGKVLAGYDMVLDVDSANDSDSRDADPSDPGDWVTSTEANAPGGPFQGCPVRSSSSWHGTHVAGTIGAASDNNAGIAGVSWGSPIVPVRVLGKCGGTLADIADGIIWAAGGSVGALPVNANPARVINLSLGGTGPCPATYRSAIATANSLGAIVVVSAGNSRAGTGGARPANCPGVIAVSATGQDGERATYSNYGRPAIISAPGGDFAVDIAVLSTLNSGTTTPGADSFAFYQGTSMAAPHVSGVAALMLSAQPSLQPHHVAAFIRGTATPYPTSALVDFDCGILGCGDGILNAANAVAAADACSAPPSGIAAPIDVACNGDFDGNGVVSALTDGLIATRLMLGVSGPALASGALGVCATRTTFDAIRRWSNANCGTNY